MKLIKFIPWSKAIKETTPHPRKTSLPEWWRKGESGFQSEHHGGVGHDKPHEGMKMCVPFMEIMMTGYELLIPFDIYVTKTESGDTSIRYHGPEIKEKDQVPFVNQRPPELGATIPRPTGHSMVGFTWFSYWSWKTPKGYSTFVTHPFNRHDLPFTTLNGIIDSDKFNLNGNIPFFLQKDFEGIIPRGTPFAQIYPFKRTKWKMWIDDTLNDDLVKKQGEPLREPNGSYKKRMWTKKEFQ